MADGLGGGKQSAGAEIPQLPDGPRNAEGHPTSNPSGGAPVPGPMFEGYPVSPAVARTHLGAPAAQGHGGGNK